MWSKIRAGQTRWLAVLVTTPVVAGLVIAVKLTGFFQLVEWATYDQFFRLRPLEPIDERLVIVTVDESDINYVKQWSLPDASLAQLIKNLNQYKPAAIGLDFYRDLPVEPGHQEWINVMKSTPNLIGVEKFVGRKVAPPPTLSKLNRVGLTDLLVDADGKVRRALLSHRNKKGQMKYSLGTHLALMYLEKQGITLKSIDQTKKHYRLGQAVFIPFTGNDGGYVRTNSGGYQIFLNYRGTQNRFRTVSLTKVLKNQIDPQLIRNRLILIGSIAPSLNDLLYTPYSSPFINTPQPVPGVVIHANITSQILSSALDGRPLIRVWGEPFEWLWILIWSGIGASVDWQFLKISFHRNHQQITTICTIVSIYIFLTGGVLITGSYFAFLSGWWVPLIPSLVALSGSALASTGYQVFKLQQQRSELARQKQKIEQEKIKAEATSQAKSEFLAKMSHELRTPLNAILGFTQIMSHSSELSDEHQEYIDIINRSGEHLLELINDILDLSKIESGMMSLNESSFDLYSLLDNLEELSELKAKNKNLRLLFDISPNVPQYIKADKKKLRICLINLLSNAIKFTEVGSVTLRVSLVISHSSLVKEKEEMTNEQEQKTLVFEVEDTGLGIAPDEIEYIFKDFVQTQTGKKSSEGTGLGLSITRNFVQLMKGEITVKSILNVGTVFKFYIQFTPGDSATKTLQPLQQVVSLEPNQAVYRILVVDDVQENRVPLVKLLEVVGFEVQEACNGKEAVDLWESWQPKLIWMDRRMPVMDGLEATKEIRAREKAQWKKEENFISNSHSPTIIIAFTASSLENKREEIFAAGSDDFVIKPFTSEMIFAKMSQYLGVRYVYKDLSQSVGNSRRFNTIAQKPNSLFQQQLAAMPASWIAKLSQAALALDEELVFQLIAEIPENQEALAEALKDLLKNFRLDLVLESTQVIMNENSSITQ